MIDATVPGTPDWWLLRLGKKLTDEQPRFDMLDEYAQGNHPLPFGNKRSRDTYRQFQRMARANFTGLVSEAVRERLQVTGFSTGASGDDQADTDAWATWQANQMDADSGLVTQAALDMSRSYVIVGKDDEGKALITPEDPRQVIHEFDPRYRRTVRAAVKLWDDDATGTRHAVVYLPNGVVYYRCTAGPQDSDLWNPGKWDRDEDEGDAGVAPNPIPGTVSVVPFINRRRIATMGMGEFEDVTDIQDRINITILDRLVTQSAQAYRQRWAKGVRTTDEHGNTDDAFEPGADLLWAVEAPDAAFGDFAQADIRMIIDACKEDVRQLAAISRTPPHYLVGELNNVNGATLKATETGLVAKCNDRKRQLGESWEQVNRFAATIEGRQIAPDAEVIWADSESRSTAEIADAAVKKQAVGVPWRQNMVDLGYSPQEIERMEGERAADALIQSLAAPPVEPVPNGLG